MRPLSESHGVVFVFAGHCRFSGCVRLVSGFRGLWDQCRLREASVKFQNVVRSPELSQCGFFDI